ncbi:DUF4097 family beta strand repeat-containing protein [Fulvivirga sp. M361]|uniref:DUF4097 family beta strand repeat-containing protein n=1 Tax=Fulvivirga sp. M361 TaxID=2594266 RepID=UPI001629550B|nr:DUF4097 family beta strand repeat-containing protein [Fulvivirga sp. M361]
MTFILFLSAFTVGSAQIQVKVITKTIERSFDYQAGDALLIRGEKSSIAVNTWEKNAVKVTLKLIAKAVLSEVARKELEYQKYTMNKRKNIINLANQLEFPNNVKELQAILLVEYEIWVPASIQLTINNEYGNIDISGIYGKHIVTNKFGNITLNHVGGTGKIESYFGDFTSKNFSGNHTLDFNKTKTTIDHLSGILSINSRLGDITISNVQRQAALNIEADKSDINLEVLANWDEFQIKLKSNFGKIKVPHHLTGKMDQKNNVSSWRYLGNGKSRINAETSFGVISLSVK